MIDLRIELQRYLTNIQKAYTEEETITTAAKCAKRALPYLSPEIIKLIAVAAMDLNIQKNSYTVATFVSIVVSAVRNLLTTKES